MTELTQGLFNETYELAVQYRNRDCIRDLTELAEEQRMRFNGERTQRDAANLTEMISAGEALRWLPFVNPLMTITSRILKDRARMLALARGEAPMIDVLVPAVNEERTLPVLLQSITAQVIAGPVRIIVADNNSTDGTAVVARELGCNVVSAPIPGCSPARGAALEALYKGTNGEDFEHIVVQTDADCRIVGSTGTDYFQRVIEFFRSRADIVATAGPVQYVSPDGGVVRGKQGFIEKYGVDMSVDQLFKFCGLEWQDVIHGSKKPRYLVGPNTCYRLEALKVMGFQFPNANVWDSVASSILLQHYYPTNRVCVNPAQIVTTGSDAKTVRLDGGKPYLEMRSDSNTLSPTDTLVYILRNLGYQINT